jgi:hypothetical protein
MKDEVGGGKIRYEKEGEKEDKKACWILGKGNSTV